MYLLLIVYAFIFCLYEVTSENHFVTKYHASPNNPDDPVNKPMQIIRYSIKIPNEFPWEYGPVFYGVAGRETLEEMQSRFKLFEHVGHYYNHAVIIFVEHRYFGNSSLTDDPIDSLDDLSGLTLKAAIGDHVFLIKKLAESLRTFNFLVFGVNHGGLLAGYISNEFSTNPLLSRYRVIAWASSTTLKYIRLETKYQNTVDYRDSNKDSDYQEINKQFAWLLTLAGCERSDIFYLTNFFTQIRKLEHDDTPNTIFEALNLYPYPKQAAYFSEKPDDSLLEFIIFLRNSIKDLAFENKKFDENGNQIKYDDNILKKLCNVMRNVPLGFDDKTPITAKNIEEVLLLVLPNYKPVGNGPPSLWRINPKVGNNMLNRKASLSAYQDCTNWQLMSCSDNDYNEDPFSNTNWNNNLSCTSLDQLDQLLFEECSGLFGKKLNSNEYRLSKNEYPRTIGENFIVTMGEDSIYYDSYTSFTTRLSDFVWNAGLAGLDGSEFEFEKECDSDKMLDVRYLILRAFGCFANIIDQSVCKRNIFNDDIDREPYSDKPKTGSCAVNDSITFPYGHTQVKFLELQGSNGKSGPVIGNVDDKENVEVQTDPPKNSANLLRKVIIVLCVIYLFLF